MAERMIEVDGVEFCTEAFGDPGDAPILLIMGTGASMLWWEEGFCRMLTQGGRFVIRYDHRDTGRSVTYEPGNPGYGGVTLTTDAAGVLDAHGLAAAHLVGVSAGGGIAQELALNFPERVLSLTLISTSPAVSTGRALPPPTAQFMRFLSTVEPDWSNPDAWSTTWSATSGCWRVKRAPSTSRPSAISCGATSSGRGTPPPRRTTI